MCHGDLGQVDSCCHGLNYTHKIAKKRDNPRGCQKKLCADFEALREWYFCGAQPSTSTPRRFEGFPHGQQGFLIAMLTSACSVLPRYPACRVLQFSLCGNRGPGYVQRDDSASASEFARQLAISSCCMMSHVAEGKNILVRRIFCSGMLKFPSRPPPILS